MLVRRIMDKEKKDTTGRRRGKIPFYDLNVGNKT